MQNSKPILLVEDDNVDVMTVKRALKDLKKENTTKPCFVLLDLNMPKMNGAEFLKTVKADKTLKKIPVVILTTSNSEQDVIESFELGAAGFMVKSVDYEKFVETIQAIERYWTLSKLPWNGE